MQQYGHCDVRHATHLLLLGQCLQLAHTAWQQATAGMQASLQGEVAHHLHTFTKMKKNASLSTVAGTSCVAAYVSCDERMYTMIYLHTRSNHNWTPLAQFLIRDR